MLITSRESPLRLSDVRKLDVLERKRKTSPWRSAILKGLAYDNGDHKVHSRIPK